MTPLASMLKGIVSSRCYPVITRAINVTALTSTVYMKNSKAFSNHCATSKSLEDRPLIDVLNPDGLRTGEALSREEIHRLGKVHRAVHLFLFDKSNNLLLQRRSSTTDHYPNMFSISLTGHVDSGEGSCQALERELKEELNLDASDMKIEFLFSFKREATLSSTYIDRQFNDVYACWADFDIKKIDYDKKDISELKLVPFVEFRKMVMDKDSELAPVYSEECADVVFFLQSRLKSNF